MGVESAPEVVHRLDRVGDAHLPGLREAHVHHVALGGRDDHTLHPALPLELADVGGDQLHPGVPETDVEGAGARDVRQVEADHLAGTRIDLVVVDPVGEHHRAEPSHEGVRRRLLAPGDEALPVDQDVV